MHLFDGDMELPEEAGQALGTLLGDAVKERAGAAPSDEPVGKLELEAELAEPEPGLYADDYGGSTRVAAADEFDQLLADTAGIADSIEPERAPEEAPKVEDQSIPSIDIDSDPGFGSESTRVAPSAEVDQLLADADEVERDLPPAPPPSGVFKAPTLPEPGSKLKQTPSGRFQTESGRFQTPSGRFQTASGKFQTASGRHPQPPAPTPPPVAAPPPPAAAPPPPPPEPPWGALVNMMPPPPGSCAMPL